MAHFNDLSTCDYFKDDALPRLVAVGWLEHGHDYHVGEVPHDLLQCLINLLRANRCPWPRAFLGGHVCSLCGDPKAYSFRNLFIPGRAVVYVAPEGIIHYIAVHNYQPPVEFVEAMLAVPDVASPEYPAALHACGWPDSYLTDWLNDDQATSSRDLVAGQADSAMPNERLHPTAPASRGRRRFDRLLRRRG